MIKYIFFDLDDTLLDFNMAERTALSNTLSHFGIEPKDEILKRYSEINKSQWKRLERGEITREQVKVGRYKILFDELGIDVSPVDTTRYYETQLSIGHFFIENAVETIKELYSDYSLFIVSNGALRVQTGRLESAQIGKYFKDIFISEEIGYNKPDKRFFDICFSKIPNFSSENSVIIGDSLTSDIQGGINSQIKTIWFNKNSEENIYDIKPDYEINSLKEIKPLIEKL